MITARIQIEDGEIKDTLEYGLIVKKSDTIFEAPIKQQDKTSYPEEPGEHVDNRTVLDAFDYNVEFVVIAPNYDMSNANAIIEQFNKLLYRQDDSGVRIYKEITYFDDYKRCKIVGLPSPLTSPESFYRRQDGTEMDCVEIKLKIRVTDPTKCVFNVSQNTDMYVIACAGATARVIGHYLYAQPDGTLLHNNTLNYYSLWQILRRDEDGTIVTYNVGRNMWFVGTTSLSASSSSVGYVYDSPVTPNAVGFCDRRGASTQEYIFLNASNLGNNMQQWQLDENSSFVFVPYQEGDTDATLQAKLDNILQSGQTQL